MDLFTENLRKFGKTIHHVDTLRIGNQRSSSNKPCNDIQLIKTVLKPEQCKELIILIDSESSFGTNGSCTIPLDPPSLGEEFHTKIVEIFPDYKYVNLSRRADFYSLHWHYDPPGQKTIQVFLNDESEYEGGRTIYQQNSGIFIPFRPIGDAVFHDDTIQHAVSPITSGKRYSLFITKF